MNDLEIHEVGQAAAWEGLNESDNPYPGGSDEATAWQDGFNDPRPNA